MWWARGRASEVYGKGINLSAEIAKDMYAAAAGKYNRGQTPKEGALAVYDGEGSGHIAFVEAVDNVNKCYYISHAGNGTSWFGIQCVKFNDDLWNGYRTLKGFIYLDEPL